MNACRLTGQRKGLAHQEVHSCHYSRSVVIFINMINKGLLSTLPLVVFFSTSPVEIRSTFHKYVNQTSETHVTQCLAAAVHFLKTAPALMPLKIQHTQLGTAG